MILGYTQLVKTTFFGGAMVRVDQTELATRKRPRSGSSSQASSSSGSNSDSGSPLGTIEATLRQHELLKLNQQKDEPSPLRCFVNALTRKKPLDCRTDTSLNRCLNLVDLTALGEYRAPSLVCSVCSRVINYQLTKPSSHYELKAWVPLLDLDYTF